MDPEKCSVSKACAYGDFDKLKSYVEEDPSCVNVPDDQGYFPLQWAALNNRVVETNYLISKGALINAADTTGQTALHWAAVRGSLPCIETLLRNGADPNISDNRGYTPCHVAAQYGQTAVLYHMALKWGVDCDTTDHDGRTPLHWAAYKGFADSVRLLLVLDARYGLADKEGCTPLHWAAIKGNGEACTVLVQGGALPTLSARDITGSTPPQLAVEKGHRYLGMHLQEIKARAEDSWFGKHGTFAWMNKTQLCPVIWILILGLLLIFISKVIGIFDHYCPWVGNTIGKGNRHLFLVFLWLELYALLTSCGVAVWQTRAAVAAGVWSEQLVWIVVFLVLSAFVSISVAVLAVAQASQVAWNVTTNELANWHRYKYLQDGNGGFSNPFNHGIKANCWEAFHPSSTPMAPLMLPRDPESLRTLEVSRGLSASRGTREGWVGLLKISGSGALWRWVYCFFVAK
eukprot:gene6397-6628_t